MQKNKEKFKKKDIKKYELLNKKASFLNYSMLPEDVINIVSKEKEVEHIKIPANLFGYLIREQRPQYLKYLPFSISIKKFIRDDSWRKYSNYMGVFSGGEPELELYLAHDVEHSVVSLLWILLHEFRHKIQSFEKSINTNVRNENYEKWIKYHIDKGIDLNDFFHVFHEILPFEIDANTFACEILNIDYPGSKFMLTDETLKLLDND